MNEIELEEETGLTQEMNEVEIVEPIKKKLKQSKLTKFFNK